MDEHTWARFSTIEPHSSDSSKSQLTWIERLRIWARQSTFRPWPVFFLAIFVACGIMVANVMMMEVSAQTDRQIDL